MAADAQPGLPVDVQFDQLRPAATAGGSLDLPLTGDLSERGSGGDFDGDRMADIAIFRPASGQWFIVNSSTGSGAAFTWGGEGDIPVARDYDGDGKADIAIFRPSTGAWWIIPSSTGTGISYTWGGQGDIPVPQDYDGDGKIDIAVFRPSTGTWYFIYSSTGSGAAFGFGGGGDIPVPGHYYGDSKTDIAFFRPSTGQWFIVNSRPPGNFFPITWGGQGDIPVPGDYDGDSKTDIAIFRPSTGVWDILRSTTGTDSRSPGEAKAISRCLATTTATAKPTSRSSAPRRAHGGSSSRARGAGLCGRGAAAGTSRS